jgi:hypothetical protein
MAGLTAGLQSLLDVYSALDRRIVKATPPKGAAPTTLEPALHRVDAGWSTAQGGKAPSLDETMQAIVRRSDAQELSTTEQARIFSAIADIARVDRTSGRSMNTLAQRESVANALAALAPDEDHGRCLTKVRNATPDIVEMAAGLDPKLGIAPVIRAAVGHGLLHTDALYVGSCWTSEKDIDGLKCVVITTLCQAPDVSLEALMAIVNPYNWAANYPRFFTDMATLQPWGEDGWTRVRETVDLLGIEPNPFSELTSVTTHLRFHTSTQDLRGRPASRRHSASARIDYELDKSTPANDDPRVKVDRGWINMWADNRTNDPTAPGVRVRTKKIVHVEGISPGFQQMALGPLGYGNASAEFLLGPAKAQPPIGWPFTYRGQPAPSPTNTPGSPSPSEPPADNAPHFARSAVKTWTDTARVVTTDYADVAGKWMAGRLTADELADYAAKTTENLIRAPFAFLEQMSRPRRPTSVPRTTRSEEGS